MLKFGLIHPTIIGVLAAAGHGATVLVTDANYPVSTSIPAAIPVVQLNLAPGLLDAMTVIRVLSGAAPFETATVMAMENGSPPPIARELTELMPAVAVEALARFDFYAASTSNHLALTVVTGEQRHYGNVLLTVGALAAPAT